MSKMKMTAQHFEVLKSLIAPRDTEERRALYRSRQFPNADKVKDLEMRYRWDLFAMAGYNLPAPYTTVTSYLKLYDYLDDKHIDTALRAIVPALDAETVRHALGGSL